MKIVQWENEPLPLFRLEKQRMAINFWCPKALDDYDRFFARFDGTVVGVNYAQRKNFGYNAQYIEYLIDTLRKNNLHSIIRIQLQKSLVVSCCSTIETVLHIALVRVGQNKTKDWLEVSTSESRAKVVDGITLKTETKLFQKADSTLDAMNFEWMIKRSKFKTLFGKGATVYENMDKLRRLRNRVHLNFIEHPTDTDWNNFSTVEGNIAIATYKTVIMSTMFTHPESRGAEPPSNLFDYLLPIKPNTST